MSHKALITAIRACDHCANALPLPPKPIVQFHGAAKILIAGQAPGSVTHKKGIPFDDASGNRLRQWLGISREVFYDPTQLAIVPMGFCYPGTGKSGDLPPRPECAPLWRQRILAQLPNVELTLIIGQYALAWHLPETKKQTLTAVVEQWQDFLPEQLPLPHPSPRNNLWLKKNPWFEAQVLPALQQRVQRLLAK